MLFTNIYVFYKKSANIQLINVKSRFHVSNIIQHTYQMQILGRFFNLRHKNVIYL